MPTYRDAPPAIGRGYVPNVFDVAALLLVVGALVLVVWGVRLSGQPLAVLDATPVALDPARLPEYALRTTLRMFAAIACSLAFTFVYATIAAKSRRAAIVMIPVLDVLQSVPILGFLTFTVVFFMGLFPGRVLGAELACVFVIFTSQAWNMTFSMYQSLSALPADLDEAARSFRLRPWQRFWRLEVPYAVPGLVWNTMMSMSGGWFFVVASEAITVGDTTVTLPGLGAWVAIAIDKRDLGAVGIAVATMAAIIVAYDQLVFRPVIAWADKFRFEQTASVEAPTSWLLDVFRRTRALRQATAAVSSLAGRLLRLPPLLPRLPRVSLSVRVSSRVVDAAWGLILAGVVGWAGWTIYRYVAAELDMGDLREAFVGALATLVRVVVLTGLASLVWVPVGVWIGLRPRLAERVQPLAQFLAAFPANLAFPVFVVGIVRYGLNPEIWLSPLMILGTQWYILFNVIAGATAFPSDLREAAASLHIRGWRWWARVILPGIFPYYVTGAITASGGAWNAAIVAEVATWGDLHLKATGLGSYIAEATASGDHARVVLGIVVMAVFVTLLNRLLWRPLHALGESRLRVA